MLFFEKCFVISLKTSTFALAKRNKIVSVGKRDGFCNSISCSEKMGKSYTTSSLGIPQGLTAARVLGCSGAM